jgi:sirohydrochlorin ferrochelatase
VSLNIGNSGGAAARSLRQNGDWKAFREALYELARQKMNQALEPSATRDDAVGYARALRDLSIAIEAATLEIPQTQIKKPGPDRT